MRFLCLHGMGTNSKIFELQTALIRHALEPKNEFVFVDGTIPWTPAPGVEEAFPHETNFLRYIKEDDISSFESFFHDIGTFIQTHGPFDGLFGFSEGGGLAAGLIAHQIRHAEAEFQFKCGILFCAGEPVDLDALQKGNLAQLDVAAHMGSLRLPAAHIWDPEDRLHPGFGSCVRELWSDDVAEDVKHGLGHSIPGKAGSREVLDTVRAIERTIERASQ